MVEDWGVYQLTGTGKTEDNGVHSPEKGWSLPHGQDVWSHSKFDVRKLQAVIKDGVCFSVTKTVSPLEETAVDS